MTPPVRELDHLTPAQEDARQAAYAHWLHVGLCTQRSDRRVAESVIAGFYGRLGRPAPHFVWTDGPATSALFSTFLRASLRAPLRDSLRPPLGASLRASLGTSLRDSLRASLGTSLRASLRDSLWSSLWDSLVGSLGTSLGASLRASLRDSLGASLGASLWDSLVGSLGDSLRASLWASLRDSLGGSLRDSLGASLGASLGDSLVGSLGDSLRASLWASLRASLGGSLRDSLWASLRDSLWASLRASLGDSLGGSHDSPWIAYFVFCGKLPLRKPYTVASAQLLAEWAALAGATGWWRPYERVVICDERPTVQSLDELGRLHHATGPAIACRDGWHVYALHGVRVPAELVTTSAHCLDVARWVTQEASAEVRREAVRKIGIEKVCAVLGAQTIARGHDHAGQDCELVLLDVGDGRRRPYLKLRNPSLGIYHLEGVPPDCRTIDAAFAFRNGTSERPRWVA